VFIGVFLLTFSVLFCGYAHIVTSAAKPRGLYATDEHRPGFATDEHGQTRILAVFICVFPWLTSSVFFCGYARIVTSAAKPLLRVSTPRMTTDPD
jgi:hypothetical protein